MARLIHPDGIEEIVHPEAGTTFSLEELQRFVGGYIERVPTPAVRGIDCVVDEEGLMKQLPMNMKASAIVGGGQMVVGSMVVLSGKERLV
tara:strand:+ start:88 stop:357 length:270 start_codon:yes stop_codon:yes gene_type:complete